MEKIVYKPRGGSARVWACKDRMILHDGPVRTGKSRGLLEKALAVADKYPKARILLMRKTRASLSESILQTFEDHVLPPYCSWKGTAQRTHREAYHLPNGSIIVPGGMDHTQKFMSSEWDMIFVFETTEFRQDEIETLSTRLTGTAMPYHQMILDCNPAGANHWLIKRANAGKLTRIQSRLEDNPRFHDGTDWTKEGRELLAILNDMTGTRLLRLRDGKWVSADGVVYGEWNDQVHVIDEMPNGWEKWPKYRSIDFGFNDPFVCQWWTVNDDEAYCYREIYRSGRIVEDHARDIVRLSGAEQYDWSVSDHDREDRETLARHGVDTTPANKEIEVGIDAVKARLVNAGNGRPRLFYLRSALVERDSLLAQKFRPTSSLEEFDAYVWKKDKDGVEHDAPKDADNHGMDAMRYFVMELDAGATPGLMVVNTGGGEKRGNRIMDMW